MKTSILTVLIKVIQSNKGKDTTDMLWKNWRKWLKVSHSYRSLIRDYLETKKSNFNQTKQKYIYTKAET